MLCQHRDFNPRPLNVRLASWRLSRHHFSSFMPRLDARMLKTIRWGSFSNPLVSQWTPLLLSSSWKSVIQHVVGATCQVKVKKINGCAITMKFLLTTVHMIGHFWTRSLSITTLIIAAVYEHTKRNLNAFLLESPKHWLNMTSRANPIQNPLRINFCFIILIHPRFSN